MRRNKKLRLEHLILKNLTDNEEYVRKAFPFLQADYFHEYSEKLLFEKISEYIHKYNSPPSSQALFIDIDKHRMVEGNFLLIECYRFLNPDDFTQVYNDSFVKQYLTALIKRQWGQNLIKFNNVQLPGGVSLNGRQLFEDAQKEIDALMEKSATYYELPPMDMIG